jgi:hypothetical protein
VLLRLCGVALTTSRREINGVLTFFKPNRRAFPPVKPLDPNKKIATAAAHTQRVLHGFFSARGCRGETTSLSRSGYARARHRHSLFSVPHFHTEFLIFLRPPPLPPFFSGVLPASRLLLRARVYTCRWASAVTRWAPRRSSAISACFTTMPRAASTFPARCSWNSSPA